MGLDLLLGHDSSVSLIFRALSKLFWSAWSYLVLPGFMLVPNGLPNWTEKVCTSLKGCQVSPGEQSVFRSPYWCLPSNSLVVVFYSSLFSSFKFIFIHIFRILWLFISRGYKIQPSLLIRSFHKLVLLHLD